MTAHETSRPTTQIYLRIDLSLEQQAVARTMPPNPSLGGTAPPQRPYSPSWSTCGYADLTTAGTATTSTYRPDIGIIRRSA